VTRITRATVLIFSSFIITIVFTFHQRLMAAGYRVYVGR
jgi:hypothetical protein